MTILRQIWIHLWRLLPIPILLLTTVGCDGTFLQTSTAHPTAQSTALPPAQTPLPASATPTAGPTILRVWLPPQFDPQGTSDAGKLLAARLTKFEDEHPNIRVETRIKPVTGEASLMASLAATSAVAPSALPDLVALPSSDLESAAVKGLLHPFDKLTNIMSETDWYPYATQMAVTQGSTFGLPFAGDALILLYRPSLTGPQNNQWETIIRQRTPVVIPADDPNALFVLSLYRSAGGILQDNQGRPILDTKALTMVFQMMEQGVQNGIFPFWMTELTTDDAAWRTYNEKRTPMAVTWLSRYLDQLPADTAAMPLPSVSDQPATLASGWMWGLAASTSERQNMAVQLAESLLAPDFLEKWTPTINLMPTRPSSLKGWDNYSQQTLIKMLAEGAQVLPTNDMLASLGPVLTDSTLMIFKGQGNAENIAQSAATRLMEP